MARKTKKKQKVKPARKPRREPSALRRWLAAVPSELWWRVGRIGISVLLVAGLVVGIAFGLDYLKGRVRAGERYVVPPSAVRIVSDPPLPVPPAVKTRLAADPGVAGPFNVLDESVLKQIASHYARRPWVRRVLSIRRVYPNRIDVDLRYRRPVAFVEHRGLFYWVDAEGVRVGDEYAYVAGPRRCGQLVIRNVAYPDERLGERVPAAGQPWPGEDLAAGLRMVGSLTGHVARRELISVDVANYGGRINPALSHVVLRTQDNTEIRWGSAPGEEGVYEIALERKLHNLAWFYNKQGPVSGEGGEHFTKKRGLQGRQFVYIRVDLPEVYYQPRTQAGDDVLRG